MPSHPEGVAVKTVLPAVPEDGLTETLPSYGATVAAALVPESGPPHSDFVPVGSPDLYA